MEQRPSRRDGMNLPISVFIASLTRRVVKGDVIPALKGWAKFTPTLRVAITVATFRSTSLSLFTFTFTCYFLLVRSYRLWFLRSLVFRFSRLGDRQRARWFLIARLAIVNIVDTPNRRRRVMTAEARVFY